MSDADRVRWDARYSVLGPGRPMPPDGLRGRTELLPAGGRALDVACGRGTVAVWLAQQGFEVDAVELSGVALAAAEELAAAHGVTVRFRQGDLDAGLPHALGSPEVSAGTYDIVVCQRFRDPALYPALAEVLAPGGLLVITVLSGVGDTGGPFRAAPGELPAAFAGLEVIDHVEGFGEATLLAVRP